MSESSTVLSNGSQRLQKSAQSAGALEKNSRGIAHEEKEVESGCVEARDARQYEPLRLETQITRLRTPSRPKSLQSVRSHRSYAGGDGYTLHSEDERPAPSISNGETPPNAEKDVYEVTWDGDNDPMNPRSRSKARKWIVVLIVSASSLCV